MEFTMQPHKIVSEQEWLTARKGLLAKEKEFTRARDRLSAERRALPWVKVDKPYVFDTREGEKSLAELFGDKSQLIVYHFMLAPGWKEGCPSCSYLADHFDGATIHLANRDVAFVVVSRAPLIEIEAFRQRMGWRFPWVSSFGSDFNFDYRVSFREEELGPNAEYNYEKQKIDSDEMPGVSVFHEDASGTVFHTYSAYARGLDILVGAYNFLDLTPKGRDEDELPWTMAWVRHHDKYGDSVKSQSCCGSEARKDDAA
jgi:predicted dithiol-disulfide oxidoreductase (DUF899 family)